MVCSGCMPRNGAECLKLHKGRGNLVIFVLKVHNNDENAMHHLLMVAV
jgi:hypothetical protein